MIPQESFVVVRRLQTTRGPLALFVERGHDGRTVQHVTKRSAWRIAGRMGGRANGYVVLAVEHDAAGVVRSVNYPRGDSVEGST